MRKQLDEMTWQERHDYFERLIEQADNRRKEIKENALLKSMEGRNE